MRRPYGVLLIQPPIEDFYDTDLRLQPIGLCYLAAAIKKWLPGTEVEVRDYHQGHGRRTVRVPGELDYLDEYYGVDDNSPFSVFNRYFHFGASYAHIATEVAELRPDLVGISSLFSPYYREVLRTADAIRHELDVPIVLGGSHVSAEPELMLRHRSVDFVIRGEGELPIVSLVRALRQGNDLGEVPNLGFKTPAGVRVFNPIGENYPIDEIPIPDLSDLPPDRYRFKGEPLTFMVTSRSCPHRCTFCSVHTTFGRTYRRRSIDNVLAEIRRRYDDGFRVIDFEDDNLTLYTEEMKSLCRALVEMFPRKQMRFTAMNGISYLSLDDELLALMRQAGFTHLNLALVSSDTTVRETTKRPHTVEKYLDVVGSAHRLGFKIVSYQILGLPSETLESMVQTLVFATRLPILLGASMFYLTPHSPIAAGYPPRSESDIVRSRLTAMAGETDRAGRDDLYTLFVTTRILNFLKGVPIPPLAAQEAEALPVSRLFDERHRFAPRTRLGLELLERLIEHGVLYAASRRGLVPRPRFNQELFARVWARLGRFQTLEGKDILVDRPARPAREASPEVGAVARR